MFVRLSLWVNLFVDLAAASFAAIVISPKVSLDVLLRSLGNGIIYLIVAELISRISD